MSASKHLQGVSGQSVGVQRIPQRRPDAIIVAFGIGACLGRTLAPILHTDFVLGGQRYAAQL